AYPVGRLYLLKITFPWLDFELSRVHNELALLVDCACMSGDRDNGKAPGKRRSLVELGIDDNLPSRVDIAPPVVDPNGCHALRKRTLAIKLGFDHEYSPAV